MPGSLTAGNPIGISSAWDARPGCPNPSVQRCGRYSSTCSASLRTEDCKPGLACLRSSHRHRLRAGAPGTAPAFDHVVVDEAQDLSVTQLRFLSALAGGAPNGLFFAGDLGQRIFQQPFSWKSLGADVRGRSRTLHITYRTPHQIRLQADRLLGPEVSDVHGNSEDRTGTVSVFNGPVPIIRLFKNEDQEVHAVANWL